ncbi:3'-5' exonuclease [Taibaiella koreensis]|uniref:3'-5' exonuclease n=1 Tax=Taibaiella koreensis TaxID=1268548 RepID=UPI000E59E516|nr:3'-5' exonuclease [Taibaiella koreensis]
MELSELRSLATYTAIDFETAHAKMWSICQVGLVRVENGVIVQELELLVQPPKNEYHWGNSRVHGLSRKDTAHAPAFSEIWDQMQPYIAGQHVVAHNADFDCACLRQTLDYYRIAQPHFHQHCTVKIYKRNLALLCETYGIDLKHHNALSDARGCAALFQMHLEGKSAAMVAELEQKFPRKAVPQY